MINYSNRLPYPEQIVLHRNYRTLCHVRNFIHALEDEGQMISFDDALRICLIASINECSLELKEVIKEEFMDLAAVINKNDQK